MDFSPLALDRGFEAASLSAALFAEALEKLADEQRGRG